MADVFSSSTYNDVSSGGSTGSPRYGQDLSTGDLRRKFNFGDRVSELSISQDPFFRFVSRVSKGATDDPKFKFTEKRGSYHKRYAYVVGHGATAGAVATNDATISDGSVDAGDTWYFRMETDYESSGNIQNIYGNSSGNNITVGGTGTQPAFFLPGQLVKIPYGAAAATFSGSLISALDGYLVARIETVDTATCEYATLKTTIVKGKSGADIELASYKTATATMNGETVASFNIATELEPKRSYVVGSAFAEGSGYPETWKDQPYSTGYGMTQIWKTSMAMTNTARATSLKYDQNEWARIWREKLIEHKWDIEHSLLFGSQYESGGIQYTQGAVDFITTYGNLFTLNTSTKTQDNFLDDMSSYLDPRYNSGSATVFFCQTDVYNWLHKLSGYFKNNLEVSTNLRADMAITGKKKVFGVDITTITTPYGDMNVARNVHLDGTHVKMLGIGMKHCKYRPLVGNGLNRDTSVYVGVQTLENSGIDRRVDLILTEAGMQWEMPEAHAVWTAS